MLNPSVEPKARRESAQARRDSEGRQRRKTAGSGRRSSGGDRDDSTRAKAAANAVGGGGLASTTRSASASSTSVSAQEARDQRRSIGLMVGPCFLRYSSLWENCSVTEEDSQCHHRLRLHIISRLGQHIVLLPLLGRKAINGGVSAGPYW